MVAANGDQPMVPEVPSTVIEESWSFTPVGQVPTVHDIKRFITILSVSGNRVVDLGAGLERLRNKALVLKISIHSTSITSAPAWQKAERKLFNHESVDRAGAASAETNLALVFKVNLDPTSQGTLSSYLHCN